MEYEQGLTPKITMIDNIENPKNASIGEKTSLSVAVEHVAARVNTLLQNLDRASRLNDPPDSSDLECNIYGENNGKFSNYNARKKKTRCYICGDRDHEGRLCKKVTNCFICSRKGHLVVDCPKKNVEVDLASRLCLKCGSTGHDMFSCVGDYDSEDLKAIECYICRKAGHLCCAGDKTIIIGASCYNCGQSDHFGWECTKPTAVACGPRGPRPFCKKCRTKGHYTRLCPYKKKVKIVAEKATERRAKRVTLNATADKAAAQRVTQNDMADKAAATAAQRVNQNSTADKEAATTAKRVNQNATADKAAATTAKRVTQIATADKAAATAAERVTQNATADKAAVRTAKRKAKRKARRACKLKTANTTPIVNPNPNQSNGFGLSPSQQRHIYYQLGAHILNSFGPRTQYPHHFYPNFQNRPQITRIPFNEETQNMRPPGTEIRRPVVQPAVPTQFSHLIQNNPQQPLSHQLPWTESHVPLNSTVFRTQFPHPRVIQNYPRQPFIHQTVIERPSMVSRNPQQYPPQPPVPTQFPCLIQNDPQQPLSHQLPWTESHVPLNSTVFRTQFPHPHVIQNYPRQPFIHQTVSERPSMGSRNPQQYPPRPGWTF